MRKTWRAMTRTADRSSLPLLGMRGRPVRFHPTCETAALDAPGETWGRFCTLHYEQSLPNTAEYRAERSDTAQGPPPTPPAGPPPRTRRHRRRPPRRANGGVAARVGLFREAPIRKQAAPCARRASTARGTRAAVENEGNVMLLQVANDRMLHWRFGDIGASSSGSSRRT